MKVLACILAICSGLFGFFMGVAEGAFGAWITIFGANGQTISAGMKLMLISLVIVVMGATMFKWPKFTAIALLVLSIMSFSYGNFLSGPFTFIAGLLVWFSRNKKPEMS